MLRGAYVPPKVSENVEPSSEPDASESLKAAASLTSACMDGPFPATAETRANEGIRKTAPRAPSSMRERRSGARKHTPMSEAETQTTENKPTTPVSIYDVIIAMVDQTAALSWQKLGLQPDMLTGQIAQNLEEAKVAIDLTTLLSTFVEPRLDEDDKRELHNLIRNLRLNYVQKAKDQEPT